MLRVAVSKVRMPRSHRITCSLPAASRYSAASSNSSTFAARPRFSSTGLPAFPTALSSEKFCMLRAPTWSMSASSATASTSTVSITSVTTGSSSLVADLAQDLEPVGAVALEASKGWSAACRRRRECRPRQRLRTACGAVAQAVFGLDRAGPGDHRESDAADVRLAEADDRVVRMHFAADELVGREDRLDRFHHRVAVEAELGEHALVAESAEHDALGAGHVQRLQPSLLDPGEDLVGVFLWWLRA